MKKKSIESLWMGKADIPFDMSEEDLIVEKVSESRKKYVELEALIDNEIKELLHKYVSSQSVVTDLEKKSAFVAGFRLGARLVVESIED